MKRILSLLMIVLTSVFLLSCKNYISSEVKLSSIVGISEDENNTREKTRYNTSYKLNNKGLDYQFVVLFNDSINFDLTIKLDNPNDYHIFDFTLDCQDKNAMVYIDDEYVLLNELKSINWKGDTNKQYTINMQVSSVEYITEINLTSMYYSNRKNGVSKELVDLNNKGTIDIYRLYDGVKVNIVDYDNCSFVMNDEHIDTNSIKINGVEYELGTILKLNDNKKTTISYDYILKDNYKKNSKIEYIKPQLYNLYVTIPMLRLNLNPIYIGENGCNVKVYNSVDDTLLYEHTFTKNENDYIFSQNHNSSKIYFVIDDKYKIN